MDELTLLRRLDADAPAPTREALRDAFDALEDRMTAAEQRGRAHVPRRRGRLVRLGRALVGTACVAALVTGLVLTDAVGIAGVRPGATAQAAEFLERAAADTIRTTDPLVGRGQYLRVERRSVHQTDGNGFLYAIHEDRTTWIPADLRDEWVEIRSPYRYAGEAWGPGAAEAGARDFPETTDRQPEILRGEAGNFFGGTPSTTPDTVDGLPRDPRMLLNHIYRVTIGSGPSPDGEALVFIGDTLRTGFADASLRSSLYRAAAMIPGVRVIDEEANLDGTTGVAIGRVEPSDGMRVDLIIDPDTGLLIGEREVLTRDLPPMPAGAVNFWSSTTTTVVGAAPTGVDDVQ